MGKFFEGRNALAHLAAVRVALFAAFMFWAFVAAVIFKLF
jgi:hypothetical protein